jgi:hypothetical protein
MTHAVRIRILIFCLAVFSAGPAFAQAIATFDTLSPTERPSNSPYLVDLNNDGIVDLVQQTLPSGLKLSTFKPAFTVRIANGDGSFRAPVSYSFPSLTTSAPMTSGDFNGDGNVDLIFASGDKNQLVLFLGKGDGTFQEPKYITVAFPSGKRFGFTGQTADFNGDGKLDLLVNTATPTSTGGLYLVPGDGKGSFGDPSLIYTPPENHVPDAVGTGDFDGDGRADIAFLDYDYCDQGLCSSTLHVLYNDGDSQFTDTTTNATVAQTGFSVSTGDLNSDGQTDIFATAYPPDTNISEFYVLYGQADRTFHTYNIPEFTVAGMADFNGDTMMDLVGTAGNTSDLIFLLGVSNEGLFIQESYAPLLPYLTAQVVGDFNFDTKPDVLGVSEKTISTFVLSESLNTTASGNWGGCAYPHAGRGIHVCLPSGSAGSPVTFNASANSFGQLRKIELWVDGKKAAEQYHAWGPRAWFDFSEVVAAGNHRGVIFATDIDNRQQEAVFNFTVGVPTCSAPSSPGVVICVPAGGSSVSSPVLVEAASNVSGTIVSTQLWVDGVKNFNSPGSDTLTTSVTLAAGTHRFAVVATNTAGQKWESTVTATVK